MNASIRNLPSVIVLMLFSHLATAEVAISEAWVRATAPGQKVGAAYMTLQSPQAMKLFYAETKSADEVEIHSMSMANGIMKMRKLDTLNLQPNKPEKLAPGSFHLMLFGLKAPLKAGEKVTLKLCFKDEKDQITHQEITLPIKEAM
jgi:periplasmic copper chaperone A